jgi:hypothetical protein
LKTPKVFGYVDIVQFSIVATTVNIWGNSRRICQCGIKIPRISVVSLEQEHLQQRST